MRFQLSFTLTFFGFIPSYLQEHPSTKIKSAQKPTYIHPTNCYMSEYVALYLTLLLPNVTDIMTFNSFFFGICSGFFKFSSLYCLLYLNMPFLSTHFTYASLIQKVALKKSCFMKCIKVFRKLL